MNCGSWGKLLNLSVPWGSHVWKTDKNTMHTARFLSGLMKYRKPGRCSAWTLIHIQDSRKVSFAVSVNSSVVAIVIDTITTTPTSVGSI